MLKWAEPQTGAPAAVVEVGLNPPWNQPQVTSFAFRRSPTLLPPMATLFRVGLAQASNNGSGSLMTVSPPCWTAGPGDPGQPVQAALPAGKSPPQVAPKVLPATTSKAPGVEGPKPVPKLLSLIAKSCA